jgi:hypothetical protein
MSPLNDLFEREKKRVVEPDFFFTQRVMARLDAEKADKTVRARDLEFWDTVPSFTRPVLALALMLIVCFVIVDLVVPQVPQRGIVESFLAPEQTPAERFLYTDSDLASQDVLQQLIAAEED